MSTFTLVHHTVPHIPFLPEAVWRNAEVRLTGTIHCEISMWYELRSTLTHFFYFWSGSNFYVIILMSMYHIMCQLAYHHIIWGRSRNPEATLGKSMKQYISKRNNICSISMKLLWMGLLKDILSNCSSTTKSLITHLLTSETWPYQGSQSREPVYNNLTNEIHSHPFASPLISGRHCRAWIHSSK